MEKVADFGGICTEPIPSLSAMRGAAITRLMDLIPPRDYGVPGSFLCMDFLPMSDMIKFGVSSFTAVATTWIPTERDSIGNRVPTMVFDGQPYSFQAFVVLVMFGFSASFCALYSNNRPRLATFFRACSTILLSFTVLFLILVLFVFKSSSSAQNLSMWNQALKKVANQ